MRYFRITQNPDSFMTGVLSVMMTVHMASLLYASEPSDVMVPPTPALPEESVISENSQLLVFPPTIRFTSPQDIRSFVVQRILSDETTQDVTAEALVTISNSLVEIHEHRLTPLADGKSEMTVRVGGQSIVVPIEVTGTQQPRPLSFRQDVMPVFMKAGCNTGSCHGAARGKDGFMLSLFGYDPSGDHFRITREQLGRRVNLGQPEASLLVEKAVGAVPHTGGKRFDSTDPMAQTLIRWIELGSPEDAKEVARCTSIQVYPEYAVLKGHNQPQQLCVIADYSDGTQRDITSLAVFMSNNDHAVAVSEQGLMASRHTGEAFVMARFDEHTVGIPVMVIPEEEPALNPAAYTLSTDSNSRLIDEQVNKKLRQLRMQPSPRCSDEEFIRRVSIDLTGLLPTAERYQQFMEQSSPDKRAQLVDELIDSQDFTDLWVSLWAEWLMMKSSNQVSYKSVLLYYNWLKDQINNDVPLDELVTNILTSQGGTFSHPPTNFYELERDTLKTAENVAQVFMGMRIQCAQCHNHPFDRWTQDDYYNFAAFFSQIGRKNAEDYREQIIFDRRSGEVKHPVTSQNAKPVFLGGDGAEIKNQDRREVVAAWLVSPENPWFARNFSNRIWHRFFGIGIVDPVDDVRASNPASNEALLQLLSDRFIDSGYNFKSLIREICLSETYQRSTVRNDSNRLDERNFSHQTVRRIKAEELLDIVCQVTGDNDKFRGLPLGSRAIEIADGTTSNYFLTTFGRASRETVCSCEVKMEPNLSQALHLINGDTVNGKVRRGGLIKQWKNDKLNPEDVIDQIYVRCLLRHPDTQEINSLMMLYRDDSSFESASEDVFWAVLNSREFLFNH